MTYEDRINEKVVRGVYEQLVDSFSIAGISKAEAITALLLLLGTQYNGGTLSPEATKKFMADAHSWLVFYFSALGKHRR